MRIKNRYINHFQIENEKTGLTTSIRHSTYYKLKLINELAYITLWLNIFNEVGGLSLTLCVTRLINILIKVGGLSLKLVINNLTYYTVILADSPPTVLEFATNIVY